MGEKQAKNEVLARPTFALDLGKLKILTLNVTIKKHALITSICRLLIIKCI